MLDPDYGPRLFALAARHPVWIIDSATNRPAIEAVWTQRRQERVERELNVVRAIDGLSPAEHVVALLRSVDAAHGPAVQDPPFRLLRVEGATLDDSLNAALLARGASSTERIDGGFSAHFDRG
ncbi:MAG: hypothetical protein HOQ09_01785 [Gemmatimonadaceae bacterium]|nr:hypothetical protein [Gemmatimonadaceae bacterium]